MIEFHRLMLADSIRNDAFAAALKSVIEPGQTTVADIGSGTGFLGILASKLGAKECHLYEMGSVARLSKKILAENNIHNCTLSPKHSTEVRHPTKVDVVVSETLGNFALEENILETLRDARRFLKPGGILIPQKLNQFACAIISDRLYREVTAWDDVNLGIEWTAAREASINNIYVRKIDPSELLEGGERAWDPIDFREDNDSIRTSDIEWKMEQDTKMFGFAVWWECELVPGMILSTSPHQPATHWEQIYLPVPSPVPLTKGATLRLRIRTDSRLEVKIHVQWEVEVRDATGARVTHYKMDMKQGMV
jgi:protein arginine N-methyltransferase 1